VKALVNWPSARGREQEGGGGLGVPSCPCFALLYCKAEQGWVCPTAWS